MDIKQLEEKYGNFTLAKEEFAEVLRKCCQLLPNIKIEAIESAYQELTDVERSEIDELCDAIILKIKSRSSKGSQMPMSKSMALELIGKIGMEFAKTRS